MGMIELVSEEQVLDAVKSNGPLIPIEVRHILKSGDSIIIGATLSTLVSRGLVLVTNIKRAVSPFYYVKGQEEKLAELSKFLNEKDRKTFEVLRQKQVLRDKEQDPLTRVSLRNIPDFAKKIDVVMGGESEVFWRWYLLPADDALNLLSKSKEGGREEKKAELQKEKEEQRKEPSAQAAPLEQKEKKKRVPREKSEKEGFLEVNSEVQQQLDSSGQPQIVAQFNDGFINKVSSFFSEGKVIIKEIRQVKKGVEYDISIEVPTPIGKVDFFCKAKSKEKCGESDLSSAYLQGQNMRLPVLFLTPGGVAKKAMEKARAEFRSMVVREI